MPEITIQFVLGVMAGVLSLVAYLFYNMAIFRGTTRPNKVTWWILTLVGLMLLSSYYAEGARTTIWVPLAYVVGPLMIAILSLKYGEGKWTSLDRVCLVGAFIGAGVWLFTSSAFWTLLINLLVDFLGLMPTIKKSYLRPENEDRAAWVLEAGSSIINLFAIEAWAFSIYIYPIYLVAVNGLIVLLLIRGKVKWRSS